MFDEVRTICGQPIRRLSVEAVVAALANELTQLLQDEACTTEEACAGLSVLRVRLANELRRGNRLGSDDALKCALAMLTAGDSVIQETEVAP